MDINFVHLVLEVSVTACLFFLSWIAAGSAAHGRYSFILACGACAAAVANTVHIGSVMVFPFLEEYNVTMLGLASQITLVTMFALIGLCSKRNHCSTKIIAAALVAPTIICTGIDMYQVVYNQMSWFQPITMFGSTIHYPFYLLMAGLWGVIAYRISAHRKYIFPPFTMVVFFSYAVVANIMIAFISPENHFMCTMLAHALKLAGYYSVILMYLVSKYQFDCTQTINTGSDQKTQLLRN